MLSEETFSRGALDLGFCDSAKEHDKETEDCWCNPDMLVVTNCEGDSVVIIVHRYAEAVN